MKEIDLKTSVMRRVYLVSLLRQIFSPFALRFYIGMVVTWQIILAVSISNIYKNSPSISHPSEFYNFISSAFINTDTWVKVLSICLLALLVWLGKDAFSNLSQAINRQRVLTKNN